MSTVIRNHDGEVLHRSANLRGIMDHARRVPVRHVRLYRGFDDSDTVN